MKKNRLIGMLLGLTLVFFSIGAFFSNEPASKTDNGRIVVALALIFGFFTFLNNLFPKK